jgi:hypothetical protein
MAKGQPYRTRKKLQKAIRKLIAKKRKKIN